MEWLSPGFLLTLLFMIFSFSILFYIVVRVFRQEKFKYDNKRLYLLKDSVSDIKQGQIDLMFEVDKLREKLSY